MNGSRAIASVVLLGLLAASSLGMGLFVAASGGHGATFSVVPTKGAPILAATGPTCSVTVTGENPTNNVIQNQINNLSGTPGSVLCVGAGTYDEQLTIASSTNFTLWGSGNSSTLLQPTTVSANTLNLDDTPALPTYAILAATNDSALVVGNLGIDGTLAYSSVAGCDAYFGIFYANTSGQILQTTVHGINQLNGCQSQNAIFANNGFLGTGKSYAQSIYFGNNTVTDYGKNGITCHDVGLFCTIVGNTVSTTAMGSGLSATNGIELAYGASGTVTSNRVSGNVYTPSSCTAGNYFFVPTNNCNGASLADASGILTYAAGNRVNISLNTLWNNQLTIAVVGNPATAWYNSIPFGGYYGIVFDFNATPGWLGLPVYAPGPYASTAGHNTIHGANVGILGYDANITLVGNTITASNVSVEEATDLGVSYQVGLSGNHWSANVSGALLGDISSYQPGDHAYPVGTYTVANDQFTNVSSVPEGGVTLFGALLTAASATVTGSSFLGFSHGLDVVTPQAGSAVLTHNTLTASIPPSGGSGIYAFAGTATVNDNSVSGYSWDNGAGWWPNSQATGIFLQSYSTAQVEGNTVTNNAIGIAVLSYLYGPFPAPAWPFAAPPSQGPITVSGNTISDSGAFGLALELNQMASHPTAAPSVTVSGNTIDSTLTGAVGAMFDQGTYAVDGNTFLGTTSTGSSGASQPTGVGSIGTASIQVLNAYDNITYATLQGNAFLNTTLPQAILNITTPAGDFATSLSGEPITFVESGLPAGTGWAIGISGGLHIATDNSSFLLDLQNGSYTYSASDTNPSYAPVAASASISVSGSGLTVTVNFALVTYTVSYVESTLPSGLTWKVTFDSVAKSLTTDGATDTLNFAVPNGTYSYVIADVSGWHQNSLAYSGSQLVHGAGVTKTLLYNEVTYSVSYSESTLPSGLSWKITFNSVAKSLTTDGGADTLTFTSPNGTFAYAVTDVSGWHQNSIPYSGSQAVNGGPVTKTLNYSEVNYTVTYSAGTLPSGLTFKVTFNSVAKSLTTDGATDSLSFTAVNGSFSYTIADISGWHQNSLAYSGTQAVNGASVLQTLVYHQVLYTVSFSESNLPAGKNYKVTFDAVTKNLTTDGFIDTLNFAAPNGTFNYTVADVPGWHLASGSPYSGTVNVHAATVTVSMSFNEVFYSVTFVAKGLPVGKNWTVTFASTTITTSSHTIVFSGVTNGSYAYTIGDVPGFHIKKFGGHYSGTVLVAGSSTKLTESFGVVKYAVTFSETGLPSGTSWSVTIGATTVSTTLTHLVFHLTNGTYSFTAKATGFTAHPASGTVTVAGAKRFRTITFT